MHHPVPLLRRLLLAFCFLAFPAEASTPEEARLLTLEMARDLNENLLPFWLKHSPNPANGGFYGEVSGDLTPRKREPRGALLTARILWTFSAAYRQHPTPERLEMARRAAADLRDHFWDKKNGGTFWSIKADGTPLVRDKHTYVQAFTLYSLAEYFQATGETWAGDLALEQYRLLEAHARDRVHGGYWESCTEDWKLSKPGKRSLIGAPSPKSQNTNLHVMEALAGLLRTKPSEEVRESLRSVAVVLMDKVCEPATGHLSLFQQGDWTPVDRTCSYGHDIEFSWLLTETTDLLGEPALSERSRRLALLIADTTLREGIDRDGGVWNEGLVGDGVTDRAKEWWPQAEAVVGFVNAYQLSGDKRYLAAALRTWRFIDRELIDHEKGEWFRTADPDPRRRSKIPKIGFWKCPYHNGRACMEIMRRLGAGVRESANPP